MSIKEYEEAVKKLKIAVSKIPAHGTETSKDLASSAKSLKESYDNWQNFMKSCSSGLSKKAQDMAKKESGQKKYAESLDVICKKYVKYAEKIPDGNGTTAGGITNAKKALIKMLKALEKDLAEVKDSAPLNILKKISSHGDEWSRVKNQYDSDIKKTFKEDLERITGNSAGAKTVATEMVKLLGSDFKNFEVLLKIDPQKMAPAAKMLIPKAEAIQLAAERYVGKNYKHPAFWFRELMEESESQAKIIVSNLKILAEPPNK